MDGLLGDVVTVVCAVAVGVGGTLILGWLSSKRTATRRLGSITHIVGGMISLLASALLLVAAVVAVSGPDATGLNGEPVARMAFALVAAVGLWLAVLVDKRAPFWPIRVIIVAYAAALAVVVVLMALSLFPPIEPLFPSKF